MAERYRIGVLRRPMCQVRVGHGLGPSMDWIGLGGMTVTPF